MTKYQFYLIFQNFYAPEDPSSDPTIGGTYMSFLWSIANLSSRVWEPLVTWLAGILDPNEIKDKIECGILVNQERI